MKFLKFIPILLFLVVNTAFAKNIDSNEVNIGLPLSSSDVQLNMRSLKIRSNETNGQGEFSNNGGAFRPFGEGAREVLLENGGFELTPFTTGWTDGGSGTPSLSNTLDLIFEREQSYAYVTSGSETMNLSQLVTHTKNEGTVWGVTCMIKSDSAKIKLCTGTTADDEKECVFYDGQNKWKLMQAILSVDATGEMEVSIKKSDGSTGSTTFVDDCRWTNDPLKVKSNLISQSIQAKDTGTNLVDNATSPFKFDDTFFNNAGSDKIIEVVQQASQTDFVVKLDCDVSINWSGALSASGHLLKVAVNGVDVATGAHTHTSNISTDVGFAGSLQAGDIITLTGTTSLVGTGDIVSINILAQHASEEVITAADIISSETIAFTFKGSGAGALDCNVDPVGTFTTFSKGVNTNVHVQCATPPTFTPTNLDGIKITAVGYQSARACTAVAAESRFDICIGRDLKGYRLEGYEGVAKSGGKIYTKYVQTSAAIARGISDTYNAVDGKLSLNAGHASTSAVTVHNFEVIESATAVNDGYFHFHASKNPVVNSAQSIPIINYSFENEFSAKIDNNGTATITSQSNVFIASVNRFAAGVVDITLVGGFFSQIPAVTLATGPQFVQVTTDRIATLTTSTIRVIIQNSATGVGSDQPFSIHVSRQSSDHKERGDLSAVIAQPTCFIKQVEVSGTQGGTFTGGDPDGGGPNFGFTRILNTLEGQCDGISLSSNVVTINHPEPYTYKVNGTAPAIAVGEHKAVLFDATADVVEIIGTSIRTSTLDSVATTSKVYGEFSRQAGSFDFELQHRGTTTRATNGFGATATFGVSEVYSVLELTRIR